LKRNNKIAMDFILEGLLDSVKEKMGNVHQPKNFGISYIISILRNLPSQRERMLKNMKVQNKKKYARHVRKIWKKKIVKKA
jgi:hypothetical protein